ncbi:MAG: NOL1/NOP2/sun family putative RNA methylase [Candidatus Altiarchaeales archaeon]|nr:NOL1/NOP2/sun family putative RNA methylase [Candidatus Altiarchaeales archaeon]
MSDSIEHYLGLIYIQEAASMIAVEALKPQTGEVVWDMAAAPGSKTTQIAAEMKNTGCILANDVDRRRLNTLRFNLNKSGVCNCIVNQADATKLRCNMSFDRILVDAPCSNSGQIRQGYSEEAFTKGEVKRKSVIQRKLIDAAEKHLKAGGVLVYSTCSLTVEENEAIADYAVKKHGFSVEKIKSKINAHEGILQHRGEVFSDDVADSLRVYPQDNGADGFFAAKMRR